MRGGGKLVNEDPLFLDMYFSFCKVTQQTVDSDLFRRMQCAHQAIHGTETNFTETVTYQEICKRDIPMPQLSYGTKSTFPLAGMKFYLSGQQTND